MQRLPEVVEDAAAARETQSITTYRHRAGDHLPLLLSGPRVVDPTTRRPRRDRLALVDATRITLANTLALLGISAPESM